MPCVSTWIQCDGVSKALVIAHVCTHRLVILDVVGTPADLIRKEIDVITHANRTILNNRET